jgi:predicted TIM-barrel fold metal-dependent hydrolase
VKPRYFSAALAPLLIKNKAIVEELSGTYVTKKEIRRENSLGATIRVLGEDRVVFASDYPHRDATFPGATKKLLDNAEISLEAKKKIMGENAQRLLGL